MKHLFFSTLFFICIGLTSSLAQESDDYTATLKEMFKVAGTEESYKTVVLQMFDMFKRQYPTVSDSIWNGLESEFLKSSLDELTEMLSPVYAKYLTLEDLKAVIAFYNSPAGKNFSRSTPLILQESMQIGEQWGRKVGENFIKQLEEKGY